MSILATKSIETLKAEAHGAGEHTLKRVLGPLNLTTLGVGAIIGAGIFVLTGLAAAQYAGLPWHTWERLLIWMAIGILIYFAYSRRHSKVQAALQR